MRPVHTLAALTLLISLLAACGGGSADPTATSEPAAEPTATVQPTATVVPSPTTTSIPTATATATVAPSPTPVSTATATPTVAPSPTPTPTATATAAPTPVQDPVVYNDIIFDGLVDENGHPQLRYSVIDADGSDLHWLTRGPGDFEGRLSISPDGTRAAFIRGAGGVYVVDIATGEEWFIAPGRASIDWSPDGTRLLLGWQENSTGSSCCGGGRELEDPPKIAMVAADGSNFWVLSESILSDEYGWIIDSDPVWSPDGSQALFTRQYSYRISREEGAAEGAIPFATLVVANADGTGLREIDTGGVSPADWGTTWAPNGHTIVFSGRIRGELNAADGLYAIEQDGSWLRRLSPPGWGFNFGFVFTPNGDTVIFNTWYPGEPALYTVNLDGSGLQQLTDPGVTGGISYSPDGSRLVLSTYDPSTETASWVLMDADWTNARPLADGGTSDWLPMRWSPDGTRIAYVGGSGPEARELRVLDVDTGRVIVLAQVQFSQGGGGQVWWPARE